MSQIVPKITPAILDISSDKDYLYYIVDKDEFWISPYNIGDFIQEHFGYYYKLIGEI